MRKKKTCREAVDTGNHCFEPRYNRKFPLGLFDSNKIKIEIKGSAEPYKEQYYVCDVCKYCGKIAERK